jgi:L-ribulose-5-phosphate 3-epimerase
MVHVSRRALLGTLAGAALGGRFVRAAGKKLKIGVTDWNLKLGAKPEAVPMAAQLGFEGVQISFGRQLVDGKLPLDNPDLIARYLSLAKENKIAIDGTCVDRLHTNGLKSDPLAVKWVSDSIRLTKAFKTSVLLLPFFGKWAIEKPEELDHVGDALREVAPEAEKAGVILGLEDTTSAENNVRVMERSRSRNVLVYYDVGNSTNAGYDVVKEIRWLGKDRICQIHLKDNPHYLGEGPIQFDAVMAAIHDIGFTGWANLETDTHPNMEVGADMRKNLAYTRQVMVHGGL